MFIVGKSFFSETLSKLNIKTVAPICFIHIPLKLLAVGRKEMLLYLSRDMETQEIMLILKSLSFEQRPENLSLFRIQNVANFCRNVQQSTAFFA